MAAEEVVQADDLLTRVRLLEDEAWALLKLAKQKAQAPEASPVTLSAASGLVGKLVDVMTLFGKISGELTERHLHAHLHKMSTEPSLPPAAVLQLAAEEVGERAGELDEHTRRGLIAALLAPPPETVHFLEAVQ